MSPFRRHGQHPDPPRPVVETSTEPDHLEAILAASSDLVTTVDRVGHLVFANAAARSFFAVGERGVSPWGPPPAWAVARYQREAQPALRSHGRWDGELALTRDGEEVAFSCVLVAHRDRAGRIERVSAISREAGVGPTPATHDELTGLPNRPLLMDRLEVALARTARLPTGVAVLCCDLDRFKVLNDGLEPGGGDEVLRQVASRLTESLRPGDTVARFAGDEFVLLCSDLASPRDAVVLAERVQDALRAPLSVDGTEVVVSVSIGIAYDEHGASRPEALVRDADAAMYRAKDRGRDRAEVFDATLRRRALDRLDTESGLRRAVDDGRLVVLYQPVIDLRDDQVSGFEALMRWDHPERALLEPAAFMAVAEETGLIVPLGMHVFAEACRQTVEWQATHDDALGVFVNFSATQLRHDRVVDEVAVVLADTGIDPGCVQIEVTEHALVDDGDLAVSQVAALKDLGLKIVIDDFGTGYASLSYLRRFPVDLLKVDRSFVAGVAADEGDTAIVRGVIDLAHRLGLTAVAEGVERDDQVAVLRDLGCERAQGYLLGRPATGPTQTAFLAARPRGPRSLRPHGGAGAA